MTNSQSKLIMESTARTVECMEYDGLFEYLRVQQLTADMDMEYMVGLTDELKVAYDYAKFILNGWIEGDFDTQIRVGVDTKGKKAQDVFENLENLFEKICLAFESLCPDNRMFCKLAGVNRIQRIFEMYEDKVKMIVFLGTTRQAQNLQRDTPYTFKTFAPTTVDVGGATHKCHNCRKEADKMLKCGGCENFRYCSKECQKIKWKEGHKRKCANLNATVVLSWYNLISGMEKNEF